MEESLFDISLIIPFYNEESSLPLLVDSLNNYFTKFNNVKTEIIFVDDGSFDNSLPILKQLNHSSYTSKIIKLSKNFGSHSAIRAGILHSSGHYITFLPADLQDPVDLIEKLKEKCDEGYDICFAYRNNLDTGFVNKLFSGLYAELMQRFVSKDFPDNGFDIVMFNKKIKKILNENIESNSSLFLQILTTGFKRSVIYYNKVERKAGKSKWTLSKKIKLLIDSFVSFSYVPIRIVSILGILFFISGIIWTFYIVMRTLIFHDLNTGWPALISVLMIGFGITNISLGIIAEYLWRTLDVSRKRQLFIIDEIIDLKYDK